MIIDRSAVISCLQQFGIQGGLSRIELITDKNDFSVVGETIRMIYLIEMGDNRRFVIKYINNTRELRALIESQSAFSDLLKQSGIDTPTRYKSNNCYSILYQIGLIEMIVTVEEWIGTIIPYMTVELLGETSKLLALIHERSLSHKAYIGHSFLYKEFTEGDTSYERLWKGYKHDFITSDGFTQFVKLYYGRLEIIKMNWKLLPRSAVQGDIYGCNNITYRNNHLAVFDFNLAGDEVLIGDILQCWFRTIFNDRFMAYSEQYKISDIWKKYIDAYQTVRPLTTFEKENLSDAYAILGSIYYTRYLLSCISHGKNEKVKQIYSFLFDLINTRNIYV